MATEKNSASVNMLLIRRIKWDLYCNFFPNLDGYGGSFDAFLVMEDRPIFMIGEEIKYIMSLLIKFTVSSILFVYAYSQLHQFLTLVTSDTHPSLACQYQL